MLGATRQHGRGGAGDRERPVAGPAAYAWFNRHRVLRLEL